MNGWLVSSRNCHFQSRRLFLLPGTLTAEGLIATYISFTFLSQSSHQCPHLFRNRGMSVGYGTSTGCVQTLQNSKNYEARLLKGALSRLTSKQGMLVDVGWVVFSENYCGLPG